MQQGFVVEQGDKSVFLNPQHEYTKKLINSEPSITRALRGRASFDFSQGFKYFLFFAKQDFFKKIFSMQSKM